ncbi:uncharacterized protein LOC129599302 [Paramacrobiotus metropolitanus]|uniref:uncharacterized protein LOC129599302 n=1 Tax=Paramacrobiotus metropolitanus TaxID=2943436 RepID=UPI0024461376|nr:uncharacterized protein LOC129599302 [Paramacrobiotus metropolitanus]
MALARHRNVIGWTTPTPGTVEPLSPTGLPLPVSARLKRLRLAQMLFVSSIWYLACYTPHTWISSQYPVLFVKHPVVQFWMRTVYFCGIAGTPMVFLIMSRDYRKRVKVLIRSICAQFVSK